MTSVGFRVGAYSSKSACVCCLSKGDTRFLRMQSEKNTTWKLVDCKALSSMGLTSSVRKVITLYAPLFSLNMVLNFGLFYCSSSESFSS